MTRSCLITGGAGFLGCTISAPIADRFHRVIALDNLHPQIHAIRKRPSALDSRVEIVVEDISVPDAWDRVLRKLRPDVVIHLAAETGTGQSLTEAGRHAHTNVYGTAVMLDALVRNNIVPRRIVLASSRAVYGEGGWRSQGVSDVFYPGQRTREQLERHEWDFPGALPVAAQAFSTQPRPVSVYGATKLAQEHVLASWANALGSELAILRLQNVYGPGQSLTNPYTGIVPLFCRIARQGESIPLYEDGRMQRDFVFIDDVCSAIVRAVDSPQASATPLDIGTGSPTTILDLAMQISKIYGAPVPHVSAQFRWGDVRHAFCNVENSQRVLNWNTEYSLERGLKRLCTWLDRQSEKEIKE